MPFLFLKPRERLRVLGFTGTVIIGRAQDGTRLHSHDVIRLPETAAAELQKATPNKVVCDLTENPVTAPYGAFVPRRVLKWSSF